MRFVPSLCVHRDHFNWISVDYRADACALREGCCVLDPLGINSASIHNWVHLICQGNKDVIEECSETSIFVGFFD